MPRRNLVWLVGIVAVSFSCWALAQGSLIPPRGPLQHVKGLPGNNLKDYERLSLLVDILEHVEQNYVHELTDEERQKFIESAIQGALKSLDEHSGYINAHDYKQFRRSNEGQFGGVGIQIRPDPESGRLMVISPIPDTPAYKAGVKPGDIIDAINGASTKEMKVEKAVDLIQGPPGTDVTLTLRRRYSGQVREVKLTRGKIQVETVLGDLRDPQTKHWSFLKDSEHRIGYIRLEQFNTKSTEELKAALARLEQQSVRALVLDLRGNPGGLLDKAEEVADLFLSGGRIVTIEGRHRPPKHKEADDDQLFCEKIPLAVLINSSSASASEIVAAALQDHGRAIVVGERSFGKGSVQNLITLENESSAVKLTTAKYVRPSGKDLDRHRLKKEDEWGVKPDIEIRMSELEEFLFLLSRRDRDVLRDDEDARDELAHKAAGVAAPLWASPWALSQPASLFLSATQSAAAYNALRPFEDKILDRALEALRDKLRS